MPINVADTEPVLLTVCYAGEDMDGEIITIIDSIGLGMDLRTQWNEYTFRHNMNNSGRTIFEMFVSPEMQPDIEVAFAGEIFSVSLTAAEEPELTPAEQAAAEARLRAKGWWPAP